MIYPRREDTQAMAVFAVHISVDPPCEIAEALQEHYPKPDHRKLSKRMYLVQSDETTDLIAEKLGIDGESGQDGPTGVVFKLNAAYSGFERRGVWEWLSKAEAKR